MVNFTKYDRRSLTYANSFDKPLTAFIIRTIEMFTGKITILRMIRAFEKRGAPMGQPFWRAALGTMGIDLLTPDEELLNIPLEGPVVAVANHPHGLVDGMILADLIGRRRTDYKILTRALLTGIDEVAASYMISVPFPHEPDAQRKSVEMRAKAMAHLKEGGLISVFPSGVVANSDTLMGPAIEREWNVFTAQMIRRSGAAVVPIYFPGANSRWYQMANRISATLRQGLLLHEVVHSCKRPQKPVVGAPISDERMKMLESDPRGFMTWLREHTLSLGDDDPASTKDT
ncbi:acyltransferase [Pseudohalocynthiibacter aestuariivivens]|uniref:Lysophospholipid acyltransferase family protein n=1 Tax=Roseovarius pelagicus TaxID=2980108 RepID=A0ABY6DGG1_9RHOB|nr:MULTISPECIES: lysophospholipid acyltransferase family protein [Rhodobacterales]QIE47619.1 acyltransferase [Pseudohalocynthiibacter aestuariivivens]UXX85120.1 lysophospholipid acyltransferase family protein [Roseovarius pelagicus]